jgi:tripartite-type tricarboxylate transporter receptor subunit TctC
VFILNKEIAGSLKDPKMQARLSDNGSEPFVSTPEEFAAYIKSEIALWAPIIKAAGVRVD